MRKIILKFIFIGLFCILNISMVKANEWKEDANGEWHYYDVNNEMITDSIKTSSGYDFYLDEFGDIKKDYFLQDYNGENYYFDEDGAMCKNMWVHMDAYKISNYEGLNDKVYLYFKQDGKAIRSKDTKIKKYMIDGKQYYFDSNGILLTGWFDEYGNRGDDNQGDEFVTMTYHADESGQLTSGWLECDNESPNDSYDKKEKLFFYFDPKDNKKVINCVKKILDKKYAFDNDGVMLSGWDYFEDNVIVYTDLDNEYAKYFSTDNDGQMVKNKWVYDVPSKILDISDYEDNTPRYFYFQSDGNMVSNKKKKIGNKFYRFDNNGIMKTGLLLEKDNVIQEVNIDKTSCKNFLKKGIWYDEDETERAPIEVDRNNVFIYFYKDDGALSTGVVNIEFDDGIYEYYGDKEGGYFGRRRNKYYDNGFLLKADEDDKFSLLTIDDNLKHACLNDASLGYTKTGYELILVDARGRTKGKGKYKDKCDNYYVINDDGYFEGYYNSKDISEDARIDLYENLCLNFYMK